MYLHFQMTKMLRILAFLLIEQCCGMELNSCELWSPVQLCKVNDYDKNKVPGTLPLTILPRFDILEVAEVNIIEGSITAIIYLTVYWKDQNIAYSPNSTQYTLVKYIGLTNISSYWYFL